MDLGLGFEVGFRVRVRVRVTIGLDLPLSVLISKKSFAAIANKVYLNYLLDPKWFEA